MTTTIERLFQSFERAASSLLAVPARVPCALAPAVFCCAGALHFVPIARSVLGADERRASLFFLFCDSCPSFLAAFVLWCVFCSLFVAWLGAVSTIGRILGWSLGFCWGCGFGFGFDFGFACLWGGGVGTFVLFSTTRQTSVENGIAAHECWVEAEQERRRRGERSFVYCAVGTRLSCRRTPLVAVALGRWRFDRGPRVSWVGGWWRRVEWRSRCNWRAGRTGA